MRPRGYHEGAESTGDARARREELSAELLRARLNQGMTGKLAGEVSGMSQSKISKIETGRLLPKVEDVERLARAYGLSRRKSVELIALSAKACGETPTRRTVFHQGASADRPSVSRAVATSSLIRTVGVSTVPDLLVSELHPNVQVRAILTEGAVRSSPQSCEDARDASRRPTVDLRILPFHSTAELPGSTFHVYDDRLVVVDMVAGAVAITGAASVAQHVARFEELYAKSVGNVEMDRLLAAIAGERHLRPVP
ncbi:Scr1 family TA system antitoxin-like transcriptional regulator [Actinosynnema sp. NPDC020468]|uniref:Scr1 family TA system antitoxin-like transcriptional regulator n=1 Tax=Actinosynnema sp. NPDC020468 TaxID=3154488 RepID=UPI0033D0CAD2